MYVPKVTSITYVKNGDRYIERCVRSVMNQTLRDIEIIVVDGGSTDKTVDILESLAKEDTRIKILNVEGSVGAQFNVGLSVAKGEYIGVCEGDDFILPEKYEKQYEIAKRNNLDVLRACYYLYFDVGGEEYRYKIEVAPSKELYDRFVLSSDNTFLASFVNGYWNGLYSKHFLETHHIFQNETKGAAFQDITFSFLTQLYAERIWFMSEPLHCYRIDNPNSSVYSEKCIQMLKQEYSLLSDILKERGLWKKYGSMFIGWNISSYRQYINRFRNEKKVKVAENTYKLLMDYNVSLDNEETGMYYEIEEIRKILYFSKEDFVYFMTENDNLELKCFQYFNGTDFENTKEVIMFGAGHFGEMMYDFLKICGKKVIVVDNNDIKQQTGFRGVPVYNPDICHNTNTKIIVVNVRYFREIVNQLLEQGIDETQIVICNNDDFFIKEIYVKKIVAMQAASENNVNV